MLTTTYRYTAKESCSLEINVTRYKRNHDIYSLKSFQKLLKICLHLAQINDCTIQSLLLCSRVFLFKMGAGIPLSAEGDDNTGGDGEWVGGDMGSNLSASFEFLPPIEDSPVSDLNGGGDGGGWAGGDHASAPVPPAKMKKKKSSSKATGAGSGGRPGGGLKKRKESFCGKATLAEASLITQAFDAVAVGGDDTRPGYLDYREGTAKAFKV